MRKLSILVLLIIISCKEKEIPIQPDNIFTVAPDINHVAKDSEGNYMEMRADYYSDKNFIIDETGKIFLYIYKKRHHWDCIVDPKPIPVPKPEFIGLNPEKIVEMPQSSLEEFIRLNTIPIDFGRNYVVIASARDTFTSPPLSRMLKEMYRRQNRTIHIIRRMTEEEKTVMRYKRSREIYSPQDIVWDTTKIILPKALKKRNP